MKICILSGIFPPDIGGPAIYVERLAEELSGKEVEVKVITYGDKAETSFKLFRLIKISRKWPRFLRHLLFLFTILTKGRDSDVFYAQNLFSVGIPGLIASKILRKKFVVKIVGNYAWEHSLMNGWFRGDLIEFQKAKNFKIRVLKKLQKILAKQANVIIVPCNYLKRVVNSWGVPENKIRVIYNSPENCQL